MNLGQAIGAGTEPAPQRERSNPSECAPLGTVNHVCKDSKPAGLPHSRKSNGIADCLRAILAQAPPGQLMRAVEIGDKAAEHGFEYPQVRAALTKLEEQADVWGEGKRGDRSFRLTDKGRAKP